MEMHERLCGYGSTTVIPHPLSRIGIHGDIAFAEQVEQRPVVGFEVRHDFGECRQGQDVNVHEGLEHPAGGGALRGLALLVGEGLRLLGQALPDAVFERGVDHEAQGHDGHQGHDAPGRLEEQCRCHEQRVFEEAEAALDFLLVLAVGVQNLSVAEDGSLRVVGGDDEAAFLQQLPGVDIGARGQLAFDGVACRHGILACRLPALLGRGGLPDDAALVDQGQLERFLERFQCVPCIPLAGEILAAEAAECLQFGFALFQMLLFQGLFRTVPGGAAMDDQPALPDPGLGNAEGAPSRLLAAVRQLARHRLHDLPRRAEGFRDPADPRRRPQFLQRLRGVQGAVGHQVAQPAALKLPLVPLDEAVETRLVVDVAARRRHQQGDARLAFAHQVQHHLVQVGAVVAAVALADVDHARRRRPVAAVVLAVDMEAGRVQVAARAGQAQLLHRAGCQQEVKRLHAEPKNGVQGAPQRVVVQHLRRDARPQQPPHRLAPEKVRRQVQGPLHKAQSDQNHRLDRNPHGDLALAQVLRDHGIDFFNQAQFIDHARHQAVMVKRVARVGVIVGSARKIGGRHRSIRSEMRNCSKWGAE
jgi:hypothetical protein